MTLILDGKSEIGAHVRRNYSICIRSLITSTAILKVDEYYLFKVDINTFAKYAD